jgi:hypothetical protein
VHSWIVPQSFCLHQVTGLLATASRAAGDLQSVRMLQCE